MTTITIPEPSLYGLRISNGHFLVPKTNVQPTSGLLIGVGLAALLGVATSGGVPGGSAPPVPIQLDGKALAIHLSTSSVADSRLESSPAAQDAPGQWIADLRWVKSESDVSISGLADLFGVTRKALYGWFEGAEPRGNRVERISVLRASLATLPSRSHRSAFFELAERRLSTGETMRGIFASKLDETGLVTRLNDALRELDPLLEKAAQRHQRRGARSDHFESDFRSA